MKQILFNSEANEPTLAGTVRSLCRRMNLKITAAAILCLLCAPAEVMACIWLSSQALSEAGVESKELPTPIESIKFILLDNILIGRNLELKKKELSISSSAYCTIDSISSESTYCTLSSFAAPRSILYIDRGEYEDP